MKNLRFHRRLGFALTGILVALRTERSFRTQVLAACVVLAFLCWVRPAPLWWATLALAAAGVLAAELVNTAVENLVDHLHPEQHPRVRIVKDCAAGAVLIASLGAVAVAVAFVWDLLRQLFQG